MLLYFLTTDYLQWLIRWCLDRFLRLRTGQSACYRAFFGLQWGFVLTNHDLVLVSVPKPRKYLSLDLVLLKLSRVRIIGYFQYKHKKQALFNHH